MDHHLTQHHIKWEQHPGSIGVDSGQAGIFNKEFYRNDDHSDTYDLPLIFGEDWSEKDGDKWYQRMCSLTLSKFHGGISDDDYGVTPDGIVSSSGYGDGLYHLMIGKVDDKIVGFEIIFITEDEEDDDEEDDDED